MLGKLRKPTDRFAPALGRYYRCLRDIAGRRQSIPTRFGFTLSGDPAMANENWESSEIAFFLEMLQSHEVVIDVGANVGLYTCLAASHRKRVLAIEPLRRNQDYLYRNLWENRFLDVEVLPMGLSGKIGLGRIYGFGGIASFVPGWAQAQESRFSVVPVTTLDTLAATRFQGGKVLIKLDVEGFELEVLSGAAATLMLAPKPTWLIEVLLRDKVIPGGGMNARFYEIFDLFWKKGYSCAMANGRRSPVLPSDVMRWTAIGQVDGDTTNFIFMEPL
jgi:FkbM family methyltransferase